MIPGPVDGAGRTRGGGAGAGRGNALPPGAKPRGGLAPRPRFGEFELIRRYFTDLGAPRADVVLGVGDDAALVNPALARAREEGEAAPGTGPVVRTGAGIVRPEPGSLLEVRGEDAAHAVVDAALRALWTDGTRGGTRPPGRRLRPESDRGGRRGQRGRTRGWLAWGTLSLTLPAPVPEWLEAFAGTLHERAAREGWSLVGGDTTRGPLAAILFLHELRPS